MFRPFASLFIADHTNKSDSRTPTASKRKPTVRPSLEELEARLLLSSLPLHVVGNQLEDSLGNVVVLRGVNVNSLEFRPDGDNVLAAESIAISDWHANLIRVPVNEDYWFGHDEWWTGAESGDGGAAYRALIGKIISTAEAANVYVMLDLHWSDMGAFRVGNDGQHFMPDNNSTLFWQSAARIYANNPAVLFDPYNEPSLGAWNQAGGYWDFTPTAADWKLWRDGGTVVEGDVAHDSGATIGAYNSPGMQGLINAIRATGATNIIAPEGLNWGSDLTGVTTGYALTDPVGNLMYQSHLYPGKDPTSAVAVGAQHPIYVGEWGDGGVVGQPSAAAAASNTAMLAFLNAHNYSWTAWDLSPEVGGDLNLLTSWNATATTPDFGALVKADLAKHVGAWVAAGTGDFNHDGITDTLWWNSVTGQVGAWISQGGSWNWTIFGAASPAAWRVAGVGDFTGDGTSDVLWMNTSTGLVGDWEIRNGAYYAWHTIAGADQSSWTLAGEGDFNADGTDDVLWMNTTTGLVGYWSVTNGTYNSWQSIAGADPASWTLLGVGNFNGNGHKSDILWMNKATGLVGDWEIRGGGYYAWHTLAGADPSAWTFEGVGRFNGNGISDLLWMNKTTGLVGAWEIRSGTYYAWHSIAGIDTTSWTLSGIGDFNGDGTDDVLWLNSNSTLIGNWQLSNFAYSNWYNIGTLPA